MWVLGVTGGIGSGKSAATDYLATLGITIVDADLCARKVVEPFSPALKQIKDHFGDDVITAQGELNRPWLRERVFANPEERKWLEQLTHPLIRDEIIKQLQGATSNYVVLASPLLFESGQAQFCDHTLVIDVAEQTQRQRASARDANSPEQIDKIIAAQMPRNERLAQANDIVTNEGTLEELHAQLDTLHAQYLTLAQC